MDPDDIAAPRTAKGKAILNLLDGKSIAIGKTKSGRQFSATHKSYSTYGRRKIVNIGTVSF
jgi:hypothetical protein